MRWNHVWAVVGLLLVCGMAEAQDGESSPVNHLEQWRALRNLTLENTGDFLRLSDIQFDSSIVCSVPFNPEEFNTVTIRYRASGIPGQTTGQIFFSNRRG